MTRSFTSTDPLTLALGISTLLIDAIRTNRHFGSDKIADKLIQLRDAAWRGSSRKNSDRTALFNDVVAGLSPDEKTQLLEGYARLGHIYEIAALAARDNFFSKYGTPKGAKDFVEAQTDADAAVERLNQPVFEPVLTQHPTNVNSRESMRVQREIAEAIATGDIDQVKAAIQKFLTFPLLKKENGETRNFTVYDETRMVLDSLGNIYKDLPKIYEQFDAPLEKKSGTYDPLTLNLKIRPASWGSAGDKDGNYNITAEDTLEAVAMHTDEIVKHYHDDLKKILEAAPSDILSKWEKKLNGVGTDLESLLEDISFLRTNAGDIRKGLKQDRKPTIVERFDALSEELVKIRSGLDEKSFLKDLESDYHIALKGQKSFAGVLDLIRKVRVFGFRFADIEYREKASEYSRAVGVIIPGYEKMTPEERTRKLTQLLTENPPELAQWFTEARARILEAGTIKSYSPDDPLPIAYHTLRRMELAADFGDMIRNNVLSECGQLAENASAENVRAQAVANMLETVLLQKFAAHGREKAPCLGVVPLFEEPQTMMQSAEIMREAYQNPAYQQHLAEVAAVRHNGHKTQQVQIAHSDSARRCGLPAARGYIHAAHKKQRVVDAEFGIRTQFFEGGSISDAYRNGVRSISATVDDFRLHDFMKFTFQGGDLLNYFNTTGSNIRLFTRQFLNAAEKFKKEDGKWLVKNQRSAEEEAIDDKAIAALIKTREQYEANDFRDEGMGTQLKLLDYKGEFDAGTKGSRGEREKPSDSREKQAAEPVIFKPEPVKKMRTIGMSETYQQAGIIPSWFGSIGLWGHLNDAMGTHQTTERVKKLCKQSPALHDAMDRMAFGLAATHRRVFGTLREKIEKMILPPDQEDSIRTRALDYLRYQVETYKKSALMAYAALTGQKMEDTRVQLALTQALGKLTDDIERKTNYRDFLLFLRDNGNLSKEQRNLLHNAGDTVMHGRCLAADDPAYGKVRLEQNREKGNDALLSVS